MNILNTKINEHMKYILKDMYGIHMDFERYGCYLKYWIV